MAKADNEFESVEEQLKWSGNGSENQQTGSEGEAVTVSKEVVKINGQYEAEEDISECQASKVAQSAKSATCFRRESKQHLDEICDSSLPAPLSGRELNLCGECEPRSYSGYQ